MNENKVDIKKSCTKPCFKNEGWLNNDHKSLFLWFTLHSNSPVILAVPFHQEVHEVPRDIQQSNQGQMLFLLVPAN